MKINLKQKLRKGFVHTFTRSFAKLVYCSFFLFLLVGKPLHAQQFVVELTTGWSNSEFKYNWEQPIQWDHPSDRAVFNFGLGASGQLYKFLYFKTQVGTNNVYGQIDIDYISTDGLTENDLSGWMDIQQTYIEFLPELRIKWLFMNLGLHLSQTRSNDLEWVTYRVDGQKVGDPRFKKNRNSGISGNAGFTPRYKNIAFLLAFGFKNQRPNRPQSNLPGLGLKQVHMIFGISYFLE